MVISWLLAAGAQVFASNPAQFTILDANGQTRVAVRVDQAVVLASPEEGLWSIATDWENGWPSQWHHASPTKSYMSGRWTVLEGRISLSSGDWLVVPMARSCCA